MDFLRGAMTGLIVASVAMALEPGTQPTAAIVLIMSMLVVAGLGFLKGRVSNGS